MNRNIFNELFNENFYKLDIDEKEKITKIICHNICSELGYNIVPNIKIKPYKNVHGMTDKNGNITINSGEFSFNNRYSLCITLIHECIHVIQLEEIKNNTKYGQVLKPFFDTILSGTPFYYLQPTETEAYKKSCQIASALSDDFKNAALDAFKMAYDAEQKLYMDMAVCGYYQIKNDNNFFKKFINSVFPKIADKELDKQILDYKKDIENFAFSFEKLSEDELNKLKEIMFLYMPHENIIDDFKTNRKIDETFNHFKIDDVNIDKTGNFYFCNKNINIDSKKENIQLCFKIENDKLHIFNAAIGGHNSGFIFNKEEYNYLKDIIVSFNEFIKFYENKNNLKFEIFVPDIICDMTKNQCENFKNDCNNILNSPSEFSISEIEELFLKSKLNSSIYSNILFNIDEENINNDLKELMSFYEKSKGLLEYKKLEKLQSFSNIFNNLKHKHYTLVEYFKNDLSKLINFDIDKLLTENNLHALELYDENIEISIKSDNNCVFEDLNKKIEEFKENDIYVNSFIREGKTAASIKFLDEEIK